MASHSDSVFKLDFDGTAIQCDDGREVSYAELKELSDQAVAGVPPRTLKILLCRNDLATVSTFVGCLNHGIVPLLLSEKIDPGLLRRLEDVYRGSVLHDDLALLLTTSGSTGSPKLVRISYDNLLANYEMCRVATPIGRDDRVVTVLPVNYTFGANLVGSRLHAGASLVLTSKSVMDFEFWQLFDRFGVNRLAGVPYMYEIMAKLRFFKRTLPTLRTLSVGGGALSPELYARYRDWAREKGVSFLVKYGATEATTYMSVFDVNSRPEKSGSVGRPVGGGRFEIEDGELVYYGANVAMGYAECAADLAKGDEWHGRLATGDLAKRDADGYFYLTGRKSRFLKIYGNRVSLAEVENLVKDSVSGVDCAAAGEDNHLVVFITDGLRAEEVSGLIVDRLHYNASSFEIRMVPEIPRTQSGKVDYQALSK